MIFRFLFSFCLVSSFLFGSEEISSSGHSSSRSSSSEETSSSGSSSSNGSSSYSDDISGSPVSEDGSSFENEEKETSKKPMPQRSVRPKDEIYQRPVFLESYHIGEETFDAFNLRAVENAFTGSLNLKATRGFISGSVSKVSLLQSRDNFLVEVKIGSVVFWGNVSWPVPGGFLTLTSKSNLDNVISFEYDKNNVSAIFNGARFELCLKKMLGLDNRQIPSRFSSKSTHSDAVKNNCIALTSCDSKTSGEWALVYKGGPIGGMGQFKLTNGLTYHLCSVAACMGITGTLRLENGLAIKLNKFDGTQNLPQEIWVIAEHKKRHDPDLTFHMD